MEGVVPAKPTGKSSGTVLPFVGVACLGAILFGYHLGYHFHGVNIFAAPPHPPPTLNKKKKGLKKRNERKKGRCITCIIIMFKVYGYIICLFQGGKWCP